MKTHILVDGCCSIAFEYTSSQLPFFHSFFNLFASFCPLYIHLLFINFRLEISFLLLSFPYFPPQSFFLQLFHLFRHNSILFLQISSSFFIPAFSYSTFSSTMRLHTEQNQSMFFRFFITLYTPPIHLLKPNVVPHGTLITLILCSLTLIRKYRDDLAVEPY